MDTFLILSIVFPCLELSEKITLRLVHRNLTFNYNYLETKRIRNRLDIANLNLTPFIRKLVQNFGISVRLTEVDNICDIQEKYPLFNSAIFLSLNGSVYDSDDECYSDTVSSLTINISLFTKLNRLDLRDLDLRTNENITEYSQLTHLSVVGCETLRTLKISTNLKKLVLGGSGVYEISVGGCNNLIDLELDRTCNINISKFTNLHRLKFYCTQSNIDLTYLSTFTNLKILNLKSNSFSKIIIPTGVTSLDISGLSRKDISFLESCTKLKILRMSYNPVTDITPLKNCAQLRELNLTNTRVTDVTILTLLTNLHNLYITGTKVKEINFLTQLKVLDASYSEIEDVSTLTNLVYLDISYAKNIKQLSFTKTLFPKLKKLHLSENQFQDIDNRDYIEKILNLHLST